MERIIYNKIEKETLCEKHTYFYTKAISTGRKVNNAKLNLPKEEREARDIENDNRARNRALSTILDYAKSNPWGHFITITFDPKQFNRYDYGQVSEYLLKYMKSIRDYTRYQALPDISYLIVPETHKDGAFHFHGLTHNLPNKCLKSTGKKWKDQEIFNLDFKGGHTTAVELGNTFLDHMKVTSYITKYITKDLVKQAQRKRLYYSSKGLKVSEVVDQQFLDPLTFEEEIQLMTATSSFKKVIPMPHDAQKIIFINPKQPTNTIL